MYKSPSIFILLLVCFNLSPSNAVDNLSDPQTYEGSVANFKAYSDRGNDVKDIHLRYFKGPTTKEYTNVRLFDSVKLFDFPTFKKEKPTVLYIHGYKETPQDESVETVIGAYLSAQPGTNVVLLEWSNMAFGSYFLNAAPNTGKVSFAVASELKKLFDLGLNFEDFHIIGHSLGAQIGGFIGREIYKLGIKLKRISALDPAFPFFYPGLLMGHIDKSDADFVDIIHTDAGAYGAPVHTGTVDFWPNNGVKFQPGCPVGIALPLSPQDLCSHWRSWRYWAESVKNFKAFPSIKANSFKDYLYIVANGSAESSPAIYMGIGADKSAVGDYYLFTNDASPFGKGK